MSNLYEILEVSEKASDEIIEKAYKTLAKKYHPDLQQSEEAKVIAGNKMKEINVAYETLIDKTKRANYDAELERKRQQEAPKQNSESQSNSYQQQEQVHQYSYQQPNAQTQEPKQTKIENWRDLLNHLTNRERRHLKKKIEKNARQEYQEMYRQYFRSMGYRVKRKLTFKGFVSIFLSIVILIGIGFLLWKIPSTHDYFVELYQENSIFKLLVDIIGGIIRALIKTFKNVSL